MTNNKPLILVTNDDGYFSKGIVSLVNGVKDFAEVVVVAPDGPRSGMSSAITSVNPIRFSLSKQEGNIATYICSGTPVDCIKIGMNEVLADRKPDLIITGINHGSNSAVAVLYSGTMGSAMEGCLFGIPSIGFSLLDHSSDADFTESERIVNVLSKKVLEEGLPEGVCLNVNIPKTDKVAGIRIARQCKGKWVKEVRQSTDGGNQPVYWLTGYFDNREPESMVTDEAVLAQNYVSVVPIKIDMTDYSYMDQIKDWENLI